MTPTDHSPQRKRDPEARRREIVQAAAELIIESGPAALTHRAVAARAGVPLGSTTQHFRSIDDIREHALALLADEIDEALAVIEPLLESIETDPRPAAEEMYAFLENTRAVGADMALMATGAADPELRELAARWSKRLTEMLAPRIGYERALAFAVFCDGATVHAALQDAPLSLDQLSTAFTALVSDPPRATEPATGPAADRNPAPTPDSSITPPAESDLS